MKSSRFFPQADLLVRCLPALVAAEGFALKGGTAINLFVRDVPRLSVDIDLAYLPLSSRSEALAAIRAGLDRIADRARQLVPGLRAMPTGRAESPKYQLTDGSARIKIEPNVILRGAVHPPEIRPLTPEAETLFGMSASVQVLSHADLYAGKLCAALDRGHPRDWFDVHHLLSHEGITDEVRRAFVVYLASHDRPMADLLDPQPKELRELFEREFADMSREPIDVAVLEAVRDRVPKLLRGSLTANEREFLLSIKRGEPDWQRLPIAHLPDLPALRWKLANIAKLRASPNRHDTALVRLRRALDL